MNETQEFNTGWWLPVVSISENIYPRRFDIQYEGWAQCTHTAEQKEAAGEWLLEVLPPEALQAGTEGALEWCLWELNSLDAVPTLVSDMWTACICEGMIAGRSVRTYIKGDTFLLSVSASYRWWREKTKELAG